MIVTNNHGRAILLRVTWLDVAFKRSALRRGWYHIDEHGKFEGNGPHASREAAMRALRRYLDTQT